MRGKIKSNQVVQQCFALRGEEGRPGCDGWTSTDPNASDLQGGGGSKETTYVADLDSLGYSVVKLLVYIGRLGLMEAVPITKVVNRQSTGK